MTLPIDTSRPLRRHSDLEQIIHTVYNASPADACDWVDWMPGVDAEEPAGCAVVAQAILGLANRDPVVAAEHCGGCGYVLVGVEPRRFSTMPFVDRVTLHRLIDQHVGGSLGPRWESTWVDCGDAQALVIIVEPPRLGDHIFPFRPDGQIYVRTEAATHRANAADIDMLSRRSVGGSEPAVMFDLHLDPTEISPFPPVPPRMAMARSTTGQVTVAVDGPDVSLPVYDAASGTDEWLADLERAAGHIVHTSGPIDPAALASFVDQWRAALPELAIQQYWSSNAGWLTLLVDNGTTTYFPDVEVTLTLPDGVHALVDKPRAEPPRLSVSRTAAGSAATRYFRPERPETTMLTRSLTHYRVSDNRVRFDPIDLRPNRGEELEDLLLLVGPEHLDATSITIGWTVAALGNETHLDASGSFSIDLRGVLATTDLLAFDSLDLFS